MFIMPAGFNSKELVADFWANENFESVDHRSVQCISFIFKKIINLTKIDRWFLVQIKEIVNSEVELANSSA